MTIRNQIDRRLRAISGSGLPQPSRRHAQTGVPATVVAGAVACLLSLLPSTGVADDLRASATVLFGSLTPVSQEEAVDPEVLLGRALFWDERLSADGKTACASCHAAPDWGADSRPRSPDARGTLTRRHSQTVFNTQAATAGLRWLADRPGGAAQALGSITGSMGFERREDLLPKLQQHGYADAFARTFPAALAPVSAENYAQALEAYQRTLRTPGAFDRWLAGDDEALDERQQRGLRRFIETGCASCHSGPLFGGNGLRRFGVVENYRNHTRSETDDPGLMESTGKESDRDVFRIQPLRNVARTAPYFHDGSVADLATAVAIMSRVQLGRQLTPDETDDIVGFLETLTGPVPGHYAPPPRQVRSAP